jgi:hypothetical protein
LWPDSGRKGLIVGLNFRVGLDKSAVAGGFLQGMWGTQFTKKGLMRGKYAFL